MTDTPMQKTRNRLAKIYGIGILAFTGFFATLTLLAKFLAHVKVG